MPGTASISGLVELTFADLREALEYEPKVVPAED
jgi:hypothetical protein